MENSKLYKALEKAIESIEDAMVTIYESPIEVDSLRSIELIAEYLVEAWSEGKNLMRKLNPPF